MFWVVCTENKNCIEKLIHENCWFCYWKHLKEPRQASRTIQTRLQSHFSPFKLFFTLRLSFLLTWKGCQGVSGYVHGFSYARREVICLGLSLKAPPPTPTPARAHMLEIMITSLYNCFRGLKYGIWLQKWALGPAYEFYNSSLILVSFSVLFGKTKIWKPLPGTCSHHKGAALSCCDRQKSLETMTTAESFLP